MAIIYLDSFEHRVLEVLLNSSGTGTTWYFVTDSAALPNHGGNFITFDTTELRPGTDHTVSLKMAPTSGNAAQVRKTISEGEVVASFYFKADANPTATCQIFAFGATTNGILNLLTDGSLDLRIGAGAVSNLAGPFTDGEWHKVDLRYDVNQNPWTLDGQVDGAAFSQRTSAVAASTVTDWNIGATTTTAVGTWWMTDLVIADTAAEYPIADHECKKREIVGKGTHSLGSGAFQDEAGSTTDDFEVSVDDAWDGTTPNLTQTGEDYVQQTANDGAAYVEFTVATTTDTDIWAVLLGTLMASEDSGTTCLCETRLVHSGTTYATTGSVDPSGAIGSYNGYRMCQTGSPGADGWTDTEFNDIVIRFGFSTDAAPDALFNSALVEYATPWADTGPRNGSGAATIGPIAAAGAADVDISGSGAAAIGPISASGTGGAPPVAGSGAADLLPISSSGAGDVDAAGSGATDLLPLSGSGTGDVDVEGSGAADLLPISASGTGTVASGAASGSGAATIGPIASSGSGATEVSSSGAADLPPAAASGIGDVLVLAAGILAIGPISAGGTGGTPIEGGLAPFAIVGESFRPEPWAETERPGRWDGTERPGRWVELERPIRWDATERPEPWVLSVRPSPFGESARPSFWAETVFVREDRAVALTMVAYGPFTENEIPEALLIRVMKPLKAGGTAPMELFAQTPAYVASVSIEDPASTVVSRTAEVMDPADLPIDYPDDFLAAEEGWVRVLWAAGDFDVEGLYSIQVTLDNGVIVLKSTDVWQPEVNVGPASAVT